MRVAVDLGYGYVKAMTPAGRVVFPSVVAPAGASTGLRDVFGAKRPEYELNLHRDGRTEHYLVGTAALSEPGAVRAWETEAAAGNIEPLLATSVAALWSGGPLHIAVGLPLLHYAKQRHFLQQRLETMDVEAAIGDGQAVRISRPRVTVLPQAIAGYYAAGERGLLKALKGTVGIIDVGYRTTDYLVVTLDQQANLEIREHLAGTLDLGMSQVTGSIQEAVQARIGRAVDRLRIESALERDGILSYRGTPIDLTVYRDEARRAVADAIMAKLKADWGEDLDFFGAVLIMGGGGADLFPMLKGLHPNMILLDEPQWANARGYLLAMQLDTPRAALREAR